MKKPTERRTFLKNAALLGGATAAVTVAAGTMAETSTTIVPELETAASSGYQVTDHIRAYYKTAQF